MDKDFQFDIFLPAINPFGGSEFVMWQFMGAWAVDSEDINLQTALELES